jgi:hypothetical protein
MKKIPQQTKIQKKPVRRNWQLHEGRNRFFCAGRLVMARRYSVFVLTLVLMLGTMTLFAVFDLPYLVAILVFKKDICKKN